jgi:hypothetical protein
VTVPASVWSSVCIVPAGDQPDAASEWTVFAGRSTPPSQRQLSRIAKAGRGASSLLVVGAGVGRARELDLDVVQDRVPLESALLAFRTAILREHELTLDRALDPDLAAALLAAEYLAVAPLRTIAVVPSREPEQPPVDWSNDSRYTDVLPRYVSLLSRMHEHTGSTPSWLQCWVFDQIAVFLRADAPLYTPTATLAPAVAELFHDALRSLLGYIDDAVLMGRPAPGVTDVMRTALLVGVKRRRGHRRPTRTVDRGRRLARVSYLFAADAPAARITLDGAVITAEHQKVRSVDFLSRPLLRERIVWVPERAILEVDSDGEVSPQPLPAMARSTRLRRAIANRSLGLVGTVAADLVLRVRARLPSAVRRYRDAWVLMDRDSAAQDNAEHLYRYLRANEPSVNAWFVLARSSPDWARLEADGFRLLQFGSAQHYLALLHCTQLVSSQVDDYVVKPFAGHLLGQPRWRYTFLQHGVIMHDLSRWLNRKTIDLFVTTTPHEYSSIVGDSTPYVFTDVEVAMIGLARHDRLLEVASEVAAQAERNWLVVMPTWRGELLGPQELGNDRALVDDFWASDFALGWREFLESDRLKRLCESKGWQLTFVPHPNMQEYLKTSPLPAHVVALRFTSVDVQTVLARSAAFVTDYSSLAMEAAYLSRPIVYYQFDREAFYSGRLYRLGEWNYERQGFGPVTETAGDAIAALEQIAGRAAPDPQFEARMRDAFPFRDGRCCQRTVAAIRSIERS